jgi:hypothetical protein
MPGIERSVRPSCTIRRVRVLLDSGQAMRAVFASAACGLTP